MNTAPHGFTGWAFAACVLGLALLVAVWIVRDVRRSRARFRLLLERARRPGKPWNWEAEYMLALDLAAQGGDLAAAAERARHRLGQFGRALAGR